MTDKWRLIYHFMIIDSLNFDAVSKWFFNSIIYEKLNINCQWQDTKISTDKSFYTLYILKNDEFCQVTCDLQSDFLQWNCQHYLHSAISYVLCAKMLWAMCYVGLTRVELATQFVKIKYLTLIILNWIGVCCGYFNNFQILKL